MSGATSPTAMGMDFDNFTTMRLGTSSSTVRPRMSASSATVRACRATVRMGATTLGAPPHRGGAPLAASTSVAGIHTGAWAARLRNAIERRLFLLHYQPIIGLQDGRVSHYEALLRLADGPRGELVAPGDFLGVAERCGLIQEIDRMVLGEAIALLGAELADRRTPVAVNLSALSVAGEGTLEHLARLLRAHAVDPRRLILELTETAAITDMAAAKAFCEAVRALGCSVALDDFGAGFGSFRYLKRLPFDYLKIDGDFVRGLVDSRNDQLVVQALVRVAQGMGKRTIAEYVGDQRTIQLLRAYGVDFGQGFGIGRPRAPLELFATAA